MWELGKLGSEPEPSAMELAARLNDIISRFDVGLLTEEDAREKVWAAALEFYRVWYLRKG